MVERMASKGATPLAVCEGNQIKGVIVLEDILKPGMNSVSIGCGRWGCGRS